MDLLEAEGAHVVSTWAPPDHFDPFFTTDGVADVSNVRPRRPAAAPGDLHGVTGAQPGPPLAPQQVARRACRSRLSPPLGLHPPITTGSGHILAPMVFTPPRSLSPSKVSSFTDCPLAFRLAYIDAIPQPPFAPAVKGTLVHSALEGLFWNHRPGERSPAAARSELGAAWEELRATKEFLGLGLDPAGEAELLSEAERLVESYFALEDPDGVRAIGVELGVETDLGGLALRGIIDRLDLNDDGGLVVVDYKTGKAPPPRFQHARMVGVHLYALLCQRLLGRVPDEVRLLYLGNEVVISAVPTEQSLQGQKRRTVAVWQAIERACSDGDFRPKASPLCRYCSYQALCPVYGGTPPAAE